MIPMGESGGFVRSDRFTTKDMEEKEVVRSEHIMTQVELFPTWNHWYLHRSCVSGNIFGVKAIVKKVTNVILCEGLDAVASDSLHFAASYAWHQSDIEKAKIYFEQNPLVPKTNYQIDTLSRPRDPLCIHILKKSNFRNPHLEVVQYILDQGIDVNTTNDHGATALHYAEAKCLFDMAKLLRCKRWRARADLPAMGGSWIGKKTADEIRAEKSAAHPASASGSREQHPQQPSPQRIVNVREERLSNAEDTVHSHRITTAKQVDDEHQQPEVPGAPVVGTAAAKPPRRPEEAAPSIKAIPTPKEVVHPAEQQRSSHKEPHPKQQEKLSPRSSRDDVSSHQRHNVGEPALQINVDEKTLRRAQHEGKLSPRSGQSAEKTVHFKIDGGSHHRGDQPQGRRSSANDAH